MLVKVTVSVVMSPVVHPVAVGAHVVIGQTVVVMMVVVMVTGRDVAVSVLEVWLVVELVEPVVVEL